MGVLGFKNSFQKEEKKEKKLEQIFINIITEERKKTEKFQKELRKEIKEINSLEKLQEHIHNEILRITKLQEIEERYINQIKKSAENQNSEETNKLRKKIYLLRKEIQTLLDEIKNSIDLILTIENETKINFEMEEKTKETILKEVDEYILKINEIDQLHVKREKEITNIRTKVGFKI